MNRYFLKVNGELHCPGAISRPNSSEDWEAWEGGEVRMPRGGPLMVVPGRSQKAPMISSGDELWIWTHEDKKFGSGWGLTAKAVAGARRDDGEHSIVAIHNVERFWRPFGFRDLGDEPTGSRLLDHARSRRHLKVYLIEDEDFGDFKKVVDRYSMPISEDAHQQRLTPNQDAIRRHLVKISEVAKERHQGSQKIRPFQQSFREAQIARHNGRCVISRCNVLEALEAAHVVPHTGAPEFEVPENGLLLRSDLHKLFDRYMWTIHPSSGRVRIASRLENTAYSKLTGREVEHKLAPEFIENHFRLFQKWEREQHT
jgi:hypothetical protein